MAKKSTLAYLFLFSYAAFLLVAASSCAAKRGCPSNSASMGAERVLGGEKPEKKSKFKIKGMNY